MADLITDGIGITSPRKLQEMALPLDGHDVTTASGVSMKQYEEQLNGLRKENFHLKLRIYFLEEKLGNGSPPAVQGLLEHNVRLQVEVEELRRQLADKQELLAAAAEAIDVLEQQGSMSADSVEMSMNTSDLHSKTNFNEVTVQKVVAEDTCVESESAGDFVGNTINNDDFDELVKLRKEHRKALQMIKRCTEKIQQKDKEIKRVKLNKELTYAQVSDTQLEKYEEILKCKDEHIKDLENKVRDLQMNVDIVQNDENSGNLQELLTRRLQGVAYFLDKLLSHKCVLSEDKKKLAESILEQSLALPVGLELDESLVTECGELRLEDLTAMLGHHRADLSDSECWSEPDRNVSLARVGLCHTGVRDTAPSDGGRPRARRARLSAASRSEEPALAEEVARLSARCESLDAANGDLRQKLEFVVEERHRLSKENDALAASLETERTRVAAAEDRLRELRCTTDDLETRLREAEARAAESGRANDALKAERRELEENFAERERGLRRAADEATVQASQAALERARAHQERLRLDRELEQARADLDAALDRAAHLEACTAQPVPPAPPSDDDRPTSPDLGIDSDRLSSLEHNDQLSLSPRSLYEENLLLKQKLSRTKATLADTLAQLNAANLRKKSVQRAICREIHRTHGVLRRARDHLEHQQQ